MTFIDLTIDPNCMSLREESFKMTMSSRQVPDHAMMLCGRNLSALRLAGWQTATQCAMNEVTIKDENVIFSHHGMKN